MHTNTLYMNIKPINTDKLFMRSKCLKLEEMNITI